LFFQAVIALAPQLAHTGDASGADRLDFRADGVMPDYDGAAGTVAHSLGVEKGSLAARTSHGKRPWR